MKTPRRSAPSPSSFVPSFLHLAYASPRKIARQDEDLDWAEDGDKPGRVATDSPKGPGHHWQWRMERDMHSMPFDVGTAEPILHTGEGHLITIAPTGSGKGVSALVPNLLKSEDNFVVIDPKGELASVTAARRRAMGQQVVILDPIGLRTAGQSDCFNPLDVLWKRKNLLIEDEAQKVADLIAGQRGITKEPFWDNWAVSLLKALILYLDILDEKDRHIGRLYDMLHGDDVVYNLAVILDTVGKKMNKVAYMEIASFLQITDITRSGVLSTAQQYVKKLASPQMRRTLGSTSFSADDFVAGKPMTIYIVIPPEYLHSHGSILRLWVTAFMKLLFSRSEKPLRNTILMIDEASQLGYMEEVEVAMTLSRVYGVKVWTVWQSLAQLKSTYPDAVWQTLIDNATVLQLFGAKNHRVREEFASLVGWKAEELKGLDATEQLLVIEGEPRRCWLPNYLRDPAYAGLAAPNPFYAKVSGTQGL